MSIEALLAALDEERDAFLEALATVDAELVTAPGVLDDWSVRDLVVHVAAWADHASAALDLAVEGRGADFAYSTADTDAMNEAILAEARTVSPPDALKREESSFAELRRRVAELDPALLDLQLGNGDTVREVIRYDGPDHYAEHAEHVRAWFGSDDDEEDDEEVAADEAEA